MAWNQPTSIKPPYRKSSKPKYPFVLIAFLTLIIATVFLLFYFYNGEPTAEGNCATEINKHYRKKVVSTVKKSPEPRLVPAESNNAISQEEIKPKGKHSGKFVDVSKAIFIPRKDPPRRFVNDAEEDIASLLEVIPGEMLIGEINYHKKNRFVKSLKAAIDNPTRINDDDDDYARELKNAVRDVVNDLSQRMNSGEDVASIMQQSRNELQELGIFRLELQNELKNIRKSNDISVEEYEDFVQAANKMLEQKGAAPLKTPKIVYRQLKLREERSKK